MQSAQKVARQLIPYLTDSHAHTFAASPFFRAVDPCPAEALTFHVTAALLSLGLRHADVQQLISDNIGAFLSTCARTAEDVSQSNEDDDGPAALDDAIQTVTVTVALVGFLEAASAQADFWRSGGRLGLIRRLRDLLSQPFLVAVEKAISTIRNVRSHDRHVREWKQHVRRYEEVGKPIGAMLLQRSFMWLLVAVTSLLLAAPDALRSTHILDVLRTGDGLQRPLTARSGDVDFRSVEMYATVAVDQMNYLESSSDYDSLSPAKQKLAYAVKGAALISYLNSLNLNQDAADAETLMAWLEDTLNDPVGMADEDLATVILKSLALLCRNVPAYAATVSRLLPRFLVQSGLRSSIVTVASKTLAFVLQMLSKDAVISTLYTLGNVLSPANERLANGVNGVSNDSGPDALELSGPYGTRHSTGSSISVRISGEEETAMIQGNVVQAICEIASVCRDDKITSLAQSMLAQKIVKVSSTVDARIITGAAALSLSGGQPEFRSLLKGYAAVAHDAVVENREGILNAVMKGRNYISANISRDSPLYDIYLEHLLDAIISKGDLHSDQSHARESDVELAAQEIAQLLQPLAIFMSANEIAMDEVQDDETHALFRDAWFNIVVHGFTPTTERGQRYATELQIMATHSPPLVLENRGDQNESDIELNPILRRGESSDRESLQKKHLTELLPTKISETKGLNYRKLIFLQSAYLVESLRADSGDCSKALSYFLEPSMRRGDVSRIMDSIMNAVMDRYLKKTLSATDVTFSAQHAASQLAVIFTSCCHRIERVQQAAFGCADRLVREIPSALCQRSSIFALLELLSLLWLSCLEAETDRYEPRTSYKSARGNVTVQLSDDYRFRQSTLESLHQKAKSWLTSAVNVAPSDVRGLLQTYLSEFDDAGAYGHMSLGRSLAVEIGSIIPSTDQRLSSLELIGQCPIDTASDFIAQYTTRQEYRYSEALPDHSLEWLSFMRGDRRASFLPTLNSDSADATTALAHIEKRVRSRKSTSLSDIRDILRRGAALLCRSEQDECAIVHYLVSIPFAMFTKESIELGVSLWLGVMNENPRMEPRLLAEIAQQWEFSIQKKLGLFSRAITSPDPFFLKGEFAPSDQEAMRKRGNQIHSMLAPHTRLLHFLSSHYNATRLGSPDTKRIFLRLLDMTLEAARKSSTHPMAREIRFHLVLFGLRVLRSSSTIGAVAQMRLKDSLLTAALSWFGAPPRWSFGSNILQVKTEIRLIVDIIGAVKATSSIASPFVGTVRSFAHKERLLLLLLENEQSRLTVWTYPLTEAQKPPVTSAHPNKNVLEVRG